MTSKIFISKNEMYAPQTHFTPRIFHLLSMVTEILAVKESKMEPGHPVTAQIWHKTGYGLTLQYTIMSQMQLISLLQLYNLS